jgi:hypothetical protein
MVAPEPWASTSTTCREVTPEGTWHSGGRDGVGVGFGAAFLRIGVAVARGRGGGRFVVGTMLGVGGATVTDVEGDGVVVAVAGTTECVAFD